MTKRSRTVLFLILAGIFLTAAPAVIFYSQGYRFNWETRQLGQVGAFYFDVRPQQAEIYIDGEKIGETGRFIGSSLSKNLLPQTYHISIQKDGYHAWQKSLPILPRRVTEAKNILLLPADPGFADLQNNVEAFWFAPNTTEALLQKHIRLPSGQDSWRLVLWDTQTNQEHPLFQAPNLQAAISNIEWAPNANAFLLRVVSRGVEQLYVQQIPRNELAAAANTTNALLVAQQFRTSLPQGMYGMAFSPTDSNILLFLDSTGASPALYQLSYTQNTPPQLLMGDVLAFAFQGNEFFWLDTKGVVWRKQSADATEATAVFSGELPLPPAAEYRLHVFSNQLFVQTNGILYWLAEGSQANEIFSGVEQVLPGPDAKKVAVAGKKELLLFFLQAEHEQPARQTGEKVFLTRISEDIGKIAWINPYYLIFVAGNTIRVSETDTRDHRNVVELANKPNANFFWQDPQKVLYLHSEGKIQVSQRLVP